MTHERALRVRAENVTEWQYGDAVDQKLVDDLVGAQLHLRAVQAQCRELESHINRVATRAFGGDADMLDSLNEYVLKIREVGGDGDNWCEAGLLKLDLLGEAARQSDNAASPCSVGMHAPPLTIGSGDLVCADCGEPL